MARAVDYWNILKDQVKGRGKEVSFGSKQIGALTIFKYDKVEIGCLIFLLLICFTYEGTYMALRKYTIISSVIKKVFKGRGQISFQITQIKTSISYQAWYLKTPVWASRLFLFKQEARFSTISCHIDICCLS